MAASRSLAGICVGSKQLGLLQPTLPAHAGMDEDWLPSLLTCTCHTVRMVIPLSGLIQPGPSFDEPLEMLSVCHDRITDQCHLLERLLPHVAAHGADNIARETAHGVLRYFDLAGEHHHQDEEVDLFPVLRKHAGEHASLAEELMTFIFKEHELMRRAWKVQLRPQLLALRDGLAALKPQTFEHFTGLYLGHIAREERELLPLANLILGEDQLREMGLRMSARRKTS